MFSSLFFTCLSITGSNQYGSIMGHTSVTTGSLLDDNHWHSVVIERYRRNVNFTLDRHTQHFRTNGDFDHLDLDYEVSSRVYRADRQLVFLPFELNGGINPTQSHYNMLV